MDALLRALRAECKNPTSFGAAFEHVVDLALWSSPEFGARIERICRIEEWPEAPGADHGIDRVVSTVDGEFWAVQAKGYSASTTLTYKSIATFLAASATGRFTMNLIVTSTNSVAGNARQVSGQQAVPTRILDRSWLDSLEVDWPADLVGLKEAVREAQRGHGPARTAREGARAKLKPHQRKAVRDVLACFDEQNSQTTGDARAKLVMPCGTGKTVTCHAVAEQLKASKILVLVPNLALLGQTMRVWQTQSRGQLRMIAVCSDGSVATRGYDEPVVHPSELLAPVTTDPQVLAAFLKGESPFSTGRSWPTVVISTYHSSPVVADAQKLVPQSVGRPFDLLVADEAHHLAGKVSKDFAAALDAQKLNARRRLFVTATPRIISTALKDALASDGRDHHVVSMGDPAVFGPTAHELRFSHALEGGLLTDYHVLVLGVDDREIAELIENRSFVQLSGGIEPDAAMAAAAIATYRLVAEHRATRLVSYHSTIARAEEFARLLKVLRQWLPPRLCDAQLVSYSIKGTMPTSKRREILRHLAQPSAAAEPMQACLIANARCLTEGIDIPTLDGIVFSDPRRSHIDVVQSVGRAIRLAKNKTRGLVVLPVALNRNEGPDRVLAGSAFAHIWEVLGALRDHDSSLAEEVDGLRSALGRYKKFKPARPPRITLDLPAWATPEFIEAIELRMIERASSSWHYNFGLLQKFVSREGHARVPGDHVEDGIKLGNWVGTQRVTKEKLAEERKSLLQALPGWVWDARDALWEAHYRALRAFAEREGHARVPQRHIELDLKLGTWVSRQRSVRGVLPPSRHSQLESVLGWTWDPSGDDWENYFSVLCAFVLREGHACVPDNHIENGINLGSWVSHKRMFREKLAPERRERLESLPGWTWSPLEDNWRRGCAALLAFVAREGHACVPFDRIENEIKLGSWVRVKRGSRWKLAPDRREYLESLPGWSWDPQADLWDANYAVLEDFVAREGHTLVPDEHVEGGVQLGKWIGTQRQKKSGMPVERRERLDSLPGWAWKPYHSDWLRFFDIACSFAAREGHARIPYTHVENGVKLGNWVDRQRQKRQVLSREQREQLESLPGWTWDPRSELWDTGYASLKSFVAREGHARVPQSHIENGIKLGVWVAARRRGKDVLPLGRREQLESLPGWTWDARVDAWVTRYAALEDFVAREGHARVPRRHMENGLRLGDWVHSQRQRRRELTSQRRAKLEALSGWTWYPHDDAWDRSLAALHAFAIREGHTFVPYGHVENGIDIGGWAQNQRAAKNKLPVARRIQLEVFPDWAWSIRSSTWERAYQSLKVFVAREGHARVPCTHVENGVKLGNWVGTQRSRRDELPEERRERLESLPGWVWQTRRSPRTQF